MADTEPKNPETVAADLTLKNEKQPVSSDPIALQSELEKANKQRELDAQRIAQLENEAKARKTSDDEAERKKLEEDGELAELAAREKKRADDLEAELSDKAKNEALDKAKTEIFGKYPKTVQNAANIAGLTLTDDTEEAKATLATKLDDLAKIVNNGQKVRGNNMVPDPTPADPTRDLALKRLKFGDKSHENMHELLKDNPGIKKMKRMYEEAQVDA
jgi:hypothetical protein